MLNSAEHENVNAHEYKNIKKIQQFSVTDKNKMLFFWHFNINEEEKGHAQLS